MAMARPTEPEATSPSIAVMVRMAVIGVMASAREGRVERG